MGACVVAGHRLCVGPRLLAHDTTVAVQHITVAVQRGPPRSVRSPVERLTAVSLFSLLLGTRRIFRPQGKSLGATACTLQEPLVDSNLLLEGSI